jgi:predicted XRE-type DNA-binding protein
MVKSTIMPGSANIFEDLGFPPQEAEHLLIRADLMLQLRWLIQTHSWTLDQASTQLSESIDRIEALLNGKIGEFTIEQLIILLNRAGMKVRLEVLPNVAA